MVAQRKLLVAAIAETIESAAHEDYPGPLEILVLNDGSSDRTVAEAERAKALLRAGPNVTVRIVDFKVNRGKAAVLKHPLDVPNYANGEFATSTVILAERVDQLAAPITPDQQTEHPYAFGQTEIILAPDHKFKKSQELIVLMQIYSPMTTPEKKFSLEATYTFYRQDPGGEKRFNSTEPQNFSSEQMGPGFDPSSGSIQAGQGVPLQSFPEGAYRLEIKVTDKPSGKSLTQNVNFTVLPL